MYTTKCPECGKIMTSVGTGETLVGYYSPEGHNHDDNCRSREYVCENGHQLSVSKQNRCPVEGCEWVGKEECFCHTGKKVKEWPESYVEKENKK